MWSGSPYLSQGMASDRRLSTTALHMQNSVPRARDVKTLQHTEIFKMKNPLNGRESWKHAGSCCMGGLLQQPLNTQWLTGTGHAFSMPNQPPTSSPARQDHSLSLSPGDGIHTSVGQEVRAVPDLHVGNPFLCFCFHKLVGNSPHRLTVTRNGRHVVIKFL